MHSLNTQSPTVTAAACMLLCLLLQALPGTAWAGEYAPAQLLGKPDGKVMGCPGGSFWDPRNGGECWSCKVGKRSVFPVDGNKACTVEGFTDFEPATRLQANKTSCPSGSFLDVGKRSCWTCPKGTRRTVFAVDSDNACERIVKKKKRKAKYVYKVDSLLQRCRKGTFANAGSRSCYTCPKGWKHDPSKRTGTNGVCYKPREVTRMGASKVHEISLSCPRGFYDPIDGGSCWTCPSGYTRQVSSVKDAKACVKVQKPKFAIATFVRKHKPKATEVIKGVSQLGCANKGANAFFDPINGGSCWTCPGSNPVRSLYPVNGNQACAAKTCGQEGGRPCFVWERIPSCNAGLVEDFLSNECRRPQNFACTAYVQSVAGLSRAVDEANAAGQRLTEEAIKRIPGAQLLLRAMARKMQEVQEHTDKVKERLPLDKAMAPMDRFLETHQDQVKVLSNMVKHGQRVQKDLRDVLLDPRVVCSGDIGKLNYHLSRLGFNGLSQPSRRTGIQMGDVRTTDTPRAMPVAMSPMAAAARPMTVAASSMTVAPRAQPVSDQGLLRHHRITFDYSLSLPVDLLINAAGKKAFDKTLPVDVNVPLTLGIQVATNFHGNTHLYFSHSFGAGAGEQDTFKSPTKLSKFFGSTALSIGYQFNGFSNSPCTDDGAYGWGFAFTFTDWLSIGMNPNADPLFSGFAITLPKPAYGWSSDPWQALSTPTPTGTAPYQGLAKPKFSMRYPALNSFGARYDATLEINPRDNHCGPVL